LSGEVARRPQCSAVGLVRRDLLAGGVASTLTLTGLGCGTLPRSLEHDVAPPTHPDLHVAKLIDIVSAVGLEWLVVVRPADLLALSWLRPSLARILRDERLDALAQATGIDLRVLPEFILAGHRTQGAGVSASTLFVVRNDRDPAELERKFRERLTSDLERREVGHQLVGVWGRIGRQEGGFFAAGRHVVGFQYDGPRGRGSARLALLHAEGRLSAQTAASNDPDVAALERRLGAALARGYWLGPFDGATSRGVRGLLAGATSTGLALQPTTEGTLALTLRLQGAYGGTNALVHLEGAFQDLAASDLGNLLGLGALRSAVRCNEEPDGLVLHVDLDAHALLGGLAAATLESVRDIMR
jgi:hypothetical protein